MTPPAQSLLDASLEQHGGPPEVAMCRWMAYSAGWYGAGQETEPAVFKSTHPAWNDENLREVATQIRTPLLRAHVRASRYSGATQQLPPVPFQPGGCGCTTDPWPFEKITRDLVTAAAHDRMLVVIRGGVSTRRIRSWARTISSRSDSDSPPHTP